MSTKSLRVAETDGRIVVDRPAPHVASCGFERASKRNAFTPAMLDDLAGAFTELEDDPEVRVIVLHGIGGHFTAGLDLPSMVAAGRIGKPLFPPHLVDPVGLFGRSRTKPVVIATEGICFTLGMELILASDITIAADDSRFAQLEVQWAMMAYAGATIRMVERLGWGNAMRYLLTGDGFDASTALRLGLVQELVPPGETLAVALNVAARIAAAAPLAVRATLANARLSMDDGARAAVNDLLPRAAYLSGTDDAAEGVAAFSEKRKPSYRGT